MPRIKKVAIYCRLSEEDKNKVCSEDDSESIKNQKLMLSEYAVNSGWEIYDIYSDDDYAGADRKRPEFNRLLKDAESKKFDIILCKTLSRFTREIEIIEKYLHNLFALWGIRFVSLIDKADTDDEANKKSRQINGLVNEWYIEDMSRNIKSVLTSKRKNGCFIGSFAPYGYMKDPERKGHLIIDEEAAQIVRRIFSLYIGGAGCSSIARILNEEGIPSPAEYKNQHGLEYKNQHYKGKPSWKYDTIKRIVASEVYIGNLVQNKAHSISYKSKIVKPTDKSEWIRVENTHEPIIAIDTWNIVQGLKRECAVRCTWRRDGSFHGVNPFSRKLVCSHCGGFMKIVNNKSGYYFRCGTRYYDKTRCEGSFISYKRLYDEVLARLKQHIKNYTDADSIASEVNIRNTYETRLKLLKDALARARVRYDEAAEANKKLYLDKLKNVIDDTFYIDLSKSFREDMEKYGKEIDETESKISQLKHETKEIKSKLEVVKGYMDIDEITFQIAGLFIDKIVIKPHEKYSRQVNIDIFWNF